MSRANDKYVSLFTNNHSIMLLVNPENGSIIDANSAACHFYGYSLTELLNLKISQINTLTNEQVLEEMQKAIKELEVGEENRKNDTRDLEVRDEVKSPLKLLVVEDDDVIRMVIEKFSLRKGWQVVSAEDGHAALAAYQQEEFDVIMMDCHMPVLDGYQTTEAIRQLESRSGAYTPIIAMTANALKGVREICLNAGMDDYLTKPIEPVAFYAMVSKWTNPRKSGI